MPRIFIVLMYFLLNANDLFSQADSSIVVPFTLADKIRLIRIEDRMESKFQEIDRRFEQMDKRFEQMDKRFEQIEKRLERLEDLVFNTTLVLLGAMLTLVGFIIWDRRTFLKPVQNELQELKRTQEIEREKTHKIIELLKEKSLYDEQLKEILKKMGLW